MAYLIDPCGAGRPTPDDATVVLVGCGGTGAYLAEAVCRLLIGRRGSLHLVDMDRVEEHNVGRQAFDRHDVGRFKAQVLAERLARRFGRVVGYSVLPYDGELHARLFGAGDAGLRLLIGCVDNAAARRALAATLDALPWRNIWWLDSGNGHNAGQVLLGNTTRRQGLRGAFLADAGLCRALPAPSLQRPDLLDAPPPAEPRPDCAEAVARGDQSPTINQAMAALAASYVDKLLAGACGWMASYLDLDDGVLRCVPAEPALAAGAAGMRRDRVCARPRARAA
jgi:PRTRC genetic system ThiF family protein